MKKYPSRAGADAPAEGEEAARSHNSRHPRLPETRVVLQTCCNPARRHITAHRAEPDAGALVPSEKEGVHREKMGNRHKSSACRLTMQQQSTEANQRGRSNRGEDPRPPVPAKSIILRSSTSVTKLRYSLKGVTSPSISSCLLLCPLYHRSSRAHLPWSLTASSPFPSFLSPPARLPVPAPTWPVQSWAWGASIRPGSK